MADVIPRSGPDNQEPRRPIQSIPLTPEQIRELEDARWARTAPEVQQHVGKFVVVRNKRVIAVGTDEVALRKQAAEQECCSVWDFAVEYVYSPESLLDMDFGPDYL